MIRPICPVCGNEVSYPTYVDGAALHFFCARRNAPAQQRHEPVWLARSKARPGGLARDLTGVR
jgi:hypothetical protein